MGVAFIIEIETGIVIDFDVLSIYCDSCTKKQNVLTPVKFDV